MITYTSFIIEIERLAAEAEKLRVASKMHLDDNFRKWRHELEGVLSQIAQVGYLLPGQVRVKGRSFGYANNDRIADSVKFQWYQTEMDDTIIELNFILDSYLKHGEPPKGTQTNALKREWPEKITLSWLYNHAPIGLWITVVSMALAIFLAGIYVGQNDIYRKSLDLFLTPPVISNTH